MKKSLTLLMSGSLWMTAGAMGAEEKNTIYSPFGKRDPFRPPAATTGREVNSIRPLERYSVEQFRLRAVLRSASSPQAMFTDPAGGSFILGEGDVLGKEHAIVSRILGSEVILTQKTVNYLGMENLIEKIVSLPDEQTIVHENSKVTNSNSRREANPIDAPPVDVSPIPGASMPGQSNSDPRSPSFGFEPSPAPRSPGSEAPPPVSTTAPANPPPPSPNTTPNAFVPGGASTGTPPPGGSR